MAASDPHPRSDRVPPEGAGCLTPAALRERLEEEVSRAERHGTELSCLLVVIENLDEMTREHGSELREQTLVYVAAALRRELRRFDRIGRGGWGERDSDDELLIILPGADSPRAEIVARRALERLRTIKVEARGTRQPLHVSVGLAAWREDVSAETLLARAGAAVRSGDQDPPHPAPIDPAADDSAAAPTRQPTAPASASASAHGSFPPVLGRAGGP
jgi:diguanylate cyclase (GGDEF)-like protein